MTKVRLAILMVILVISMILGSCAFNVCQCKCECCKTTTTSTTTTGAITTWIDDLKLLVEEYYSAINEFPPLNMLFEAKVALYETDKIYSQIHKLMRDNSTENNVDKILGNNPDEEGNYEFETMHRIHLQYSLEIHKIYVLMDKMIEFLNSVHDTVCTENNHIPIGSEITEPGTKYCDCEMLSENYNPDKVDLSNEKFQKFFKEAFDAMWALLTEYEFTEEQILDEKMFTEYKEIFLLAYSKDAKAKIDSYVTDKADPAQVFAQTYCYLVLDTITDITFSVECETDQNEENDVKIWSWSEETQSVFDLFRDISSKEFFDCLLE